MKPDKTKNIFESFDDLCVLMNNLKQNGSFSLIEKDIMLEKLRTIYNVISKENTDDNKRVKNFQKVNEVTLNDSTDDKHTGENIIDENEFKEEKITNEQEIEIISKDINDEKEKSSTLGERYQGNKKFMDEHISKGHPLQDISVKLQSKPIEDIGKAIGLNDKFLFINELFNGDSALYKKIIDKLNNSNDFNEAFTFLNDHFQWDMKDEAVQRFMEIVKRKFITPVK